VRIVTDRRENVLTVRNEAIRFRPPPSPAEGPEPSGGQARLWVLGAGDAIRPKLARLGVKGDSTTEILDGDLQPGDAVVLRKSDTSATGSK
jgi:hypothetical protein